MDDQDTIEIGSRLELLVDDALLASLHGGAQLRLHHPTPREAVLVTDKPWEGSNCGYVTVFQDGDRYRMYYKANHYNLYDTASQGGHSPESHPLWIAYAESRDGIHWTRPELGLIEFEGSKDSNLLWQGAGPEQHGVHGFAPFRDPNPACEPGARYKAVGGIRRATRGDLYAMQSPDGIHWSLLQKAPVMRGPQFDSQNLAFWDTVRGEYRAYIRDSRDGRRDIRTATSADFCHWSEPAWLAYPGAPDEQLYTNQVQPYHRAPHIYLGFPTRYVERPWSPSIEALPELDRRRLRAQFKERYGTALTDGLFMSSRDGTVFRRWGEAFLRPGPQQQGNWAYGDNYQCWGMIETPSCLPGAPRELSFYATEHYWREPATIFRRYTLRLDGFVSLNAPRSGGGFVTKPLTFQGRSLQINFATSAAGYIRVELQDTTGRPIDGFSLVDCHEAIGDAVEREVSWKGSPTLDHLAGKPVRLCIEMSDADLYAFQFRV